MDSGTTLRSTPGQYLMRVGHAIGERWNDFWFTPHDAYPLGVLRILTGLMGIGYLLTFTADFLRWFGPQGILPPRVVQRLIENPGGEAVWRFSPLHGMASPTSLWLFHLAGLLIMAALAAGLFSRVSNGLALLIVLSYVHRAPMLAGPAEAVLTMLLAYLALTPSGACLSADAWLRGRRKSAAPQAPGVAANVGLRLIQVHTAAFYAMTGLTMLGSRAWWSGEAIWRLIGSSESRLVDWTSLAPHIYLTDAVTHLVVGFLLVFGLLIWRPLARPLLLAGAVVVWGLLALISGQLAYACSMLVASAAFWPYRGRPAAAAGGAFQ